MIIDKLRKVGVTRVMSWKHASDVLGEPAVMMRDLLRDKDGRGHTLEPGDLVWIDLRVIIERAQ